MKQALQTVFGLVAMFGLVQGCAVEGGGDEIASSQQLLACNDNSGVNPYKAALAVAMAMELGSIDPAAHLTWSGNTPSNPWYTVAPGRLALSSAAQAICNSKGGCPNLDSILALQSSSVNTYIPTYEFNTTTLRSELYASFQRQADHTASLKMNAPSQLPGPHSLSLASKGDLGGCGTHYTFSVTMAAASTTASTTSTCTDVRPTGTGWDAATCYDWATRTTECRNSWMINGNYCNQSCGRCSSSTTTTTTTTSSAYNLRNNLVFFGIDSGNTYIDFRYTENTIAIDPTVGLNTTTQTAGTCGYGFSVYDPTWYSYGKCCYYNNQYGTWAVASWAANTFYCKR